jgi:hypothetical protein
VGSAGTENDKFHTYSMVETGGDEQGNSRF